ncbi:MFS transporter [Ralstonia nicotianae]|uniref:MFS transporter n=1 Tax=Ralstonia pseudosolanacearum TaxID=1310165 RepID=UPI0020046CD2|nr:MFS transporter [Ralstonia pseudosolanacearum]MCK4120456.1 MFS transporter [Ralstonia pseudosolanacearum]
MKPTSLTHQAAPASGGAHVQPRHASARSTLVAALLGFFVITLDAVVVNVALPTIGHDFQAGVTGLQWVVDGYTLLFAALLLSAGALTDRIGARRAFGLGLVVFIIASGACGLAPTLGLLVVARVLQGAGAAVMMPSSMALIRQAYPEPTSRAHAVAIWAMGGAVAASSGPVLGGLLTLLSWRWIFLINLPVGVVTLVILKRVQVSPTRDVPFDLLGQVTAILTMGALTYGAIEAGAIGLSAVPVLAVFSVAALALLTFVMSQRRAAHPMVPPNVLKSLNARIAMAIGFTFMVGYFGLPFVMSLYLQQHRGLSAFATGAAFLPMMLTGLVLTPFSARLAARWSPRVVIVAGLLSMSLGLFALSALPASTAVWQLCVLMMLVGLAGPLVAPPVTAVLLASVPASLAGTAAGVFNTSRQVGGALAVAVFGALLAQSSTFMTGMRTSLMLAGGIAIATALAGLRLQTSRGLRR